MKTVEDYFEDYLWELEQMRLAEMYYAEAADDADNEYERSVMLQRCNALGSKIKELESTINRLTVYLYKNGGV